MGRPAYGSRSLFTKPARAPHKEVTALLPPAAFNALLRLVEEGVLGTTITEVTAFLLITAIRTHAPPPPELIDVTVTEAGTNGR
jgi:hypothetical protein